MRSTHADFHRHAVAPGKAACINRSQNFVGVGIYKTPTLLILPRIFLSLRRHVPKNIAAILDKNKAGKLSTHFVELLYLFGFCHAADFTHILISRQCNRLNFLIPAVLTILLVVSLTFTSGTLFGICTAATCIHSSAFSSVENDSNDAAGSDDF